MSTTFGSEEIQRQALRVGEESAHIKTTAESLAGYSETISGIIKSEDSKLAADWNEIATAFRSAGKVASSKGELLQKALDQYAKSTILNETQASEKAKSASEGIVDVNAQLESLL